MDTPEVKPQPELVDTTADAKKNYRNPFVYNGPPR